MRIIAALLIAGTLTAGTITLTPANVSAVLSGISSGIDIIRDGKQSTPVMGAQKIGAVVLHPFHPRAALQRLKSTAAVRVKKAKKT